MFGTKMNVFNDFSTNNDLEFSLMFDQRVEQIRNLIDIKQPRATLKTADNKELQRKIQDNSHSIKTNDLLPGQIVYLKEEGMLRKLDPRFGGPYTIVRKNKADNYVLQDALGNVLKDSYPLQKLKFNNLMKSNEIESVGEVVSIISHKDDKSHGRMYLVKWSTGEESWVKTKDFFAVDLINKYHKNMATKSRKDTEVLPPVKRTRPLLPRKTKNNFSNNFLLIFIIILLIPIFNSFELTGKFQYCNVHDTPHYWDESHECQKEWGLNQNNDVIDVKGGLYSIYTLEHDQVSGDGYQCSKKEIIWTYEVSFWGQHIESSKTNIVKLSRDECNTMVQRKVCGENSKMTCSGNVCWYTPIITPKFQWLRTIEITDYSCQFAPRIIRSPYPDYPLFGAACTAKRFSMCIT
jgi:hypothetical protein